MPSGEKAAVSTQAFHLPGATSSFTRRPLCTSKIVIRALGALKSPAATSSPPGENANERMMPGARSASVPIRTRARGGKDVRASVSSAGLLEACAVASADCDGLTAHGQDSHDHARHDELHRISPSTGLGAPASSLWMRPNQPMLPTDCTMLMRSRSREPHLRNNPKRIHSEARNMISSALPLLAGDLSWAMSSIAECNGICLQNNRLINGTTRRSAAPMSRTIPARRFLARGRERHAMQTHAAAGGMGNEEKSPHHVDWCLE